MSPVSPIFHVQYDSIHSRSKISMFATTPQNYHFTRRLILHQLVPSIRTKSSVLHSVRDINYIAALVLVCRRSRFGAQTKTLKARYQFNLFNETYQKVSRLKLQMLRQFIPQLWVCLIILGKFQFGWKNLLVFKVTILTNSLVTNLSFAPILHLLVRLSFCLPICPTTCMSILFGSIFLALNYV